MRKRGVFLRWCAWRALAWAGALVLGGLAAGVAQGQEPPQAEKQAAPAGGAAKPEAPAADARAPEGDAPEAKAPARDFSRAVLIRFEGPIDSWLEQYFYRKLDRARELGADLVIAEIDSPGGEVDASLAIAERLRALEWAHTVAYVPREGLSGAAIVALGAHEIVMGPEAVLGDAGPIFMDENFLFQHAPEKFRSHLAQRVRTLATARGRPPALAEAMVDMNLEVFQVTRRTDGKVTYMSQAEIDALADKEDWEKGPLVHESRKEHFLEVTGTRAVTLGLAEATAAGRAELKTRYGLAEDPLVLEATTVDTVVYILNFKIVMGLLIVIGLVALYIEFSAPGIGMGGLVALLVFLLFFWSRFLGGTADWLDVVLFVAGLVFLAVELFVLPGFGVAGLTGVLLILASLILASQRFIIPETSRQLTALTASLAVVAVSGVTFGVIAVFLSKHFGALPLLNRFMLAPPERPLPTAEQPAAAAGPRRLEAGDVGVAQSQLRPAGKAQFGDRYVDVVADGDFIAKGTRVRVVEVVGNRIVVAEEV